MMPNPVGPARIWTFPRALRSPWYEEWRMGGDSNPRYRIRVHTLSRRAQSTALSPIQFHPS